MPTPDTGERLALIVWPAEVYAEWWNDARPQGRAKVYVTDRRVIVWTAPTIPEAPNQPVYEVPRIALEATHSTAVKRDRSTFHGQVRLDTDRGPLTITRAQGCGCHHPLTAVGPPVAW